MVVFWNEGVAETSAGLGVTEQLAQTRLVS